MNIGTAHALESLTRNLSSTCCITVWQRRHIETAVFPQVLLEMLLWCSGDGLADGSVAPDAAHGGQAAHECISSASSW